MKIISSQTLFCSALALLLAAAVTSRDAAAGGGGAPEPGAGCEAALEQTCSVVHGPAYSGSAVISYDGDTMSAVFTSMDGATQRGNSGCMMGPPLTGGQSMNPAEFNSLTRRDIRGFCVTGATNECEGTELAEVTAVQSFDAMVPGQYAVRAHLVPITCM